MVDELPQVAGFLEIYGKSAFHCPYCDGWEVRDQPLAVYGRGEKGVGLALELTAWSRDLVLFSDGPAQLDDVHLARLSRNGIGLCEVPIERLEGEQGILASVRLADGESVPRRALFFITPQHQQSDLAARLGCQMTERGVVRTGEYEDTNVPGVFVAGDASRRVELVVVAAAEGAEAAFAINTSLLREDLA